MGKGAIDVKSDEIEEAIEMFINVQKRYYCKNNYWRKRIARVKNATTIINIIMISFSKIFIATVTDWSY